MFTLEEARVVEKVGKEITKHNQSNEKAMKRKFDETLFAKCYAEVDKVLNVIIQINARLLAFVY